MSEVIQLRPYDPSMSRFDVDVARGLTGELFVLEVEKAFAKRSVSKEIKTDFKFISTGNFYVEYMCRGRDGEWRKSGISTTKSGLWIVVLGSQKTNQQLPAMLVIDTDWMRRAARLAFKQYKRRAECKYGENPTKGVLVSLQHIIQSAPVT